MIKKCRQCILPSNFPDIYFNSEGVCNFCIKKIGVLEAKLDILPDKIKKAKKIIVGLSGGRDSIYGIDFLRKNTTAEIIAFTYDWPLVNGRARRNASRIVVDIEVEHVIRAPKSFKHLKYIRRIVWALSKKPDPRAVPLLLATDKFFFSEAKKVAKKYSADCIVFCAGNDLEFTYFKSSLSGARSERPNEMLELKKNQALKMLFSYIGIYARNPRLIIAGIILPLRSFLVTYFSRPNIEYLYKYISWDQTEIEKVLRRINWEGYSENLEWRSGDGTAAFYNYIYRTLLGYDERTTNLANQIRSGLISRDKALELEAKNASIDLAELKTYANTVGFQLDEFFRNFNRKSRYDAF